MRDDILIQAIDNTEDVLLHGGKWSEEAKQRVREARRAEIGRASCRERV